MELLRPVMAHLRFMGLRMVVYLDNIRGPGDFAEANQAVYHSPGAAGFYSEQVEVNPSSRPSDNLIQSPSLSSSFTL